MQTSAKIYVAGHQGLVGSSLTQELKSQGHTNIITKSFSELDLRKQQAVFDFFKKEKPDYVFLAAAKVGGIHANNTYPAEFIYDNLSIATNIIHASYLYGVKKLLNLGSSCIYPKNAPQPLREEYLLTGPLEATNEPYAIAKIAAIKLCHYYNKQYRTNFCSVMPTNLYGPHDNFNISAGHVLPSLLRKFHLAKLLEKGAIEAIKNDLATFPFDKTSEKTDLILLLKQHGITKESVELWGTGTPFREFLYVEDLAKACVHLMKNMNSKDLQSFVNIGTGKDIQIKDLAEQVKHITGFTGRITYNSDKPDGTPKKLLDVSKIDALGWKHSTSLEEGIEKTYNWYLNKTYQLTTNNNIQIQKGSLQ